MSGLWKDPLFGFLAVEMYRRYGLVFEGGQGHLFRKRVTRRAEETGYPEVERYLEDLRARGRDDEYERLGDLLTVNETYFFREEEHFQTLLDDLWPAWSRAGEDPIRVWSAGCSTGCEAYTLAILLKERGLVGPGRPRVQIVATDVNTRVLEEARRGVYGDFALRNTLPCRKERHFAREGPRYRLAPELLAMVEVRRYNLLRPDSPFPPTWFHAIFCRNVLIYFDADAKRTVVGLLNRSLRPGGTLIVGRSESLFNVPEAPPMVNVGGVLVHRKPVAAPGARGLAAGTSL